MKNLAIATLALAVAAPAHADSAFHQSKDNPLSAIPTTEWLVCKPVKDDTVYIEIDFGAGYEKGVETQTVENLTVHHVLPSEVVNRAEQYREETGLLTYEPVKDMEQNYTVTWVGTHDQIVYDKNGVETGTQKYRMTGELELVKGRVNDAAKTHVWRYKEVVWSEPMKDDGDKTPVTPVINTTCHATKYQGYEAKPELLRR